MKLAYCALVPLILSGCSHISPYAKESVIDDALKLCGLGYETQAGMMLKTAYDYAEKKGGMDLGANMQENLETQVTALAKTQPSEKSWEVVSATQQCVIDYVETYRPKTRKDFIMACRDDLQDRVAGKGRQYPMLKNWEIVKTHDLHSENFLVMYAYVDTGGRTGYSKLVGCEIENDQYIGLVSLPIPKS
ncbi:hypothetical protein HJ171_23075 [Vibrio parahaemolyticus]|uniref:hypothetical protein n=1 Tax=Vibrio parahaemolyticus TaxID=670 RepID=UPI00041B1A1B|nr:hypothetical protein [Vibrio parahaemolyticus]EHR7861371.1 hypothetical protein [Vibrio parahaemolyticus]EJC6932525.1 hypothetical protein [Vibrio parahaemolyticus]EKA7382515.1 hypothetical protein [Vibrio parahaemolyticus]ELY3410719.1 hypothetical protein [Vibrio parahaemolyticus]KOE91579.1 hypothetical protein ACS91_02645 [Vibrio parahaemolyticus]